MFFAAKNNSVRCLEALLKAGADPNIGIQVRNHIHSLLRVSCIRAMMAP